MQGAARARLRPDSQPDSRLSSSDIALAIDARNHSATLRCGRFRLILSRPLIMGIVNVTPDSFADGGRHFEKSRAFEHALKLLDEGADIVDIGGESTRPGAAPLSVDEELQRVMPVVEALSSNNIPISVDTFKPEVMRAVLDAGASMINDICALGSAPAMAIVARANCAVCLMHKQNDPATMQLAPHYSDVVSDVKSFLEARIAAAETAGISRDRIVIDPGFGFGKTATHNLLLLRELRQFAALGVPVLVGLSRKSTVGHVTGRAVDARVHGSVAAALLAVERGAAIVRVHDVAATRDALAMFVAVRNADHMSASANCHG
jgi:dihydropteroate synthase